MVRGVPNDPLLIVPAPVEEESAFDEETKEEAGGAAEKALAPTSDADDANCGDEVARTALIVAAAPLAIVAAPFYLGYQAAGSFCADIEPAEPSEIAVSDFSFAFSASARSLASWRSVFLTAASGGAAGGAGGGAAAGGASSAGAGAGGDGGVGKGRQCISMRCASNCFVELKPGGPSV